MRETRKRSVMEELPENELRKLEVKVLSDLELKEFGIPMEIQPKLWEESHDW